MATANTLVYAGVPRVNLLPRPEIERRARARLTRGWAWGVVGALVVALLLSAGAFALKWVADMGLAAEQARSGQLLAELASLSEVSQALATEAELEGFRAQAMASDLDWSATINSIGAALPADVSLRGFDLIVGGAPQGEDATAEVGLTGTLTFISPTPIDIAPAVRSMRAIDGVLMVDGQAVTSDGGLGGQYTYGVSIVFDQSLYSGAYAVENGEG